MQQGMNLGIRYLWLLALLGLSSTVAAQQAVPYLTNSYPTNSPSQWPAPAVISPESPRVAQGPLVQEAPPLVQEAPPPMAQEMQPPILEDSMTMEDPSWLSPYDWVQVVDWDGGVELGLNGSDGNSESMSLRAGVNLKRKTDRDETKTELTYLKATAAGIESQHNAIFNAGYEHYLGETPWTYFLKTGLEYDEFKAFDLRFTFNGGLGYHWWKTERLKLKTRFGAGVSHEIGGPDEEWTPEAVLGADYEWKITDRQKLSSTVDYYPQWSDFNDYRLVSDLGWEVLLDDDANLSLKFSVKDRYDSTPNGRRPNDVDYAILLLWSL